MFDTSREVTITGTVTNYSYRNPDVTMLVQWAARDNDRTMLYAAELPITEP